MPGFDGTGPRGEGPITGRGEGYCVLVLPRPGQERDAWGYAGLCGRPVRLRCAALPSGPSGRPPTRGPGRGRCWGRRRLPYSQVERLSRGDRDAE